MRALLLLGVLSCAGEALAQPPTPIQVSPAGPISTPTTTYVWRESAGATLYYLTIESATGAVYKGFFGPAGTCSAGTCSANPGIALVAGDYGWYVQAQNASGKEWGWGLGFTVLPPPAPTELTPSGTVTVPTPTYTWGASAGSTQYFLQLKNESATVFQSFYNAAEVCAGVTCTATPPITLPAGPYSWWVQAKSAAGGTWGPGKTFTVYPPPGPTLRTPNNATYTPTPTYRWDTSPGATEYFVQVRDATAVVFQGGYAATQVCSGSSCSLVQPAALAQDAYTWAVQAKNASGGTWSADRTFTISGPPAPGPSTPAGSVTTPNPTYVWSATGGQVTYYALAVSPAEGEEDVTPYFEVWYDPSSACSGGTCSATPGNTLRAGNYTWTVRGRNATGPGGWGTPKSFAVYGPPPPTPLSPGGMVAKDTPTYTWSVASTTDVMFYNLSVENVDGDAPTPVFEAWFQPGDVCSGQTCSGTPGHALEVGHHRWSVRAWSAAGPGSWSAPLAFWAAPPTWRADSPCFGVMLTGDFNGDGRTDRLCSADGVTYVSLSTQGGFAPGTPWVMYQLVRPVVGDFDGDGKTDLGDFDAQTATFRVTRSTGQGFAPLATWGTASVQGASCQGGTLETGTGDFDGDSLSDVYCKASTNGKVFVGRSDGASFSFSVFADFVCDTGGERVGTADFDADGQSDWYCVSKASGNVSGLLSNGTRLEEGRFSALAGGFCSWDKLVLVDVNGDGTTDAYCPTNGKLAFSTGVAFLHQGAFGEFCLDGGAVFPADLDGDGLPEMVCNHPGDETYDIEMRKWTGTALGAPTIWRGGSCRGGVTGGDFDGDAKTDLLCDHARLAISGTSGMAPDLMVRAENGLGGRTTVAYTPTSFLAEPNEAPVRPVARSITVDDGRGGSSTTTYSYSGARYDRRERRALGFASVRTTLPCLAGETACPSVVTTYSQALPSVGRPLLVNRQDGAGNLLSSQSFEYRNGAALPRTSLLIRTDDRLYAQDATRHTATAYDYDVWGNQTLVRSEGDADTGGDELETSLTFLPNREAYIVSRVAKVEQRVPGEPALTQVFSEYDQSGNWQTPPLRGDATAIQRWLKWDGAEPEDRKVTQRLGYDPFGNLTSATDETGRTVRTTYDEEDHLFAVEVTNAAAETEQKVTRLSRVCGAPLEVQDANGTLTSMQCDELCRPTRTDLPLGGFVEWLYQDLGNPNAQRTRVESNAGTGVSGRDWSEAYFDGLGRTYRTRERGPAASVAIVTEQSHNVRGALESQTEPFYEGDSPRSTTYEYDTLNRLVRSVLPGDVVVQTSYGAWSQTTKDPNEKEVKTRFDAYGHTVRVKRKLDGQDIFTFMTYDRLGRQTGMKDALGNTWEWGYDSLGRLRDEKDPDTGRSTYTYDDSGRPRTQKDAKLQETILDYESASGRLHARSSGAGTVTYTYGEARTGYSNVGRLTTITSPAEVTRLDYDALGRVVRQRRTIEGVEYKATKTYDEAGFLLGTTYPDGDTVGTAGNPLLYDEAGRLRAIPGVVTSIEYDAAGRPLARTNANQTSTTWTYEPGRGVLERILSSSPSEGTLQDLGYTIDPAGLVSNLTSPVTGEGWHYEYDDLYRLETATNLTKADESQSFVHDAIGRMTYNSRVGSYEYPLAGQPRPYAPKTVAGSLFQYDDNGNLSSGGGRSPVWDAENRIAHLGGTQFAYDGFGERIRKTSSAGTSLFPFGDDYEITNGEVTKYISVEGLGVIAKRVGAGSGSATFWLHTDHLGSIQVVTDAAGAVVSRRTYRPYGQTLGESGSHRESRGWIDQRNDADTGLTYLHARYFDPKLGTFLSPDPIGPAGGLNAYSYGFGDPINLSDPGGLNPQLYFRYPGDENDPSRAGQCDWVCSILTTIAAAIGDLFGGPGGGGNPPPALPPGGAPLPPRLSPPTTIPIDPATIVMLTPPAGPPSNAPVSPGSLAPSAAMPFNPFINGASSSVGDSVRSIGLGLFGSADCYFTGNCRLASLAYELGPLGQTANADGFTHYGTRGALAVSGIAVSGAAYGLGVEALAAQGHFGVSTTIANRAAMPFLRTGGSRWFSQMQAQHLIRMVPRLGNYMGRTPLTNWLTTFRYAQPGGGEVVLNWWTRTVIHANPFF